MSHRTSLLASLSIAVVSVVAASQGAIAGDYVWARSPWGSYPMGQYASSMTNGYGGYYVRRDAPGNNYEGRGRFTNPNGYIIPAQSGTNIVNRPRFFRAR